MGQPKSREGQFSPPPPQYRFAKASWEPPPRNPLFWGSGLGDVEKSEKKCPTFFELKILNLLELNLFEHFAILYVLNPPPSPLCNPHFDPVKASSNDFLAKTFLAPPPLVDTVRGGAPTAVPAIPRLRTMYKLK